MAENTNYIGVAMGLDVSELKAGLSEANRQIQLANSEFKAASSGMDDWTKSTEGLTAKVKQLDTVLNLQKSKLAGLEAEYEKVAKEQGENSEAARKLRVQINNQKAVVNATQKEFNNYSEILKEAEAGTIDLEEVTLKAGKAIKKTGKEAEDAGDGFTIAKGAVAGFIANGLTALVGKAIEAGKAMFALAEETREYRDDMSKLKTAFKSANHSVETATEVYDDFYKILGESDRTVEAVNHLAEFTDNTEELSKWGKIASGVTAKFGDSLPIEGLTEAANETAKVGTLTGSLADALNWAGVSEKNFQEKLDACTDEQERAKLITDTLNGLYEEAGNEYNELTKETQAARDATNKMEQAQAKMGEAIEPVTTKWNNMKASMLDWAANVVGEVVAGFQNGIEVTDLLTESQRELVDSAQDATEKYKELQTAATETANAEIANIDYTNQLWKELQTLADENGKVKEGYEGRAEFILNQLNNALGTEYEMNGNIIKQYGNIKQSIEDVMNAKKAEILLAEYEEIWLTAIKNRSEAETARATLAQQLVAQEEEVRNAQVKAEEARAEYETALAEGVGGRRLELLKSTAIGYATAVQVEKDQLAEMQGAYNEQDAMLKEYYSDIASYEQAHALILQGETEKGINILQDLGDGFKTVAGTAKMSADEQKKVLEQQVIDTEVNAVLMKDAYEQGVEGVTEEMVKTAEEQAEKAKEQFLEVGGEITKGIAEGAEEEEWTLTGAMSNLINDAVNAARKAAGIESPSKVMRKKVGVFLGQGAGAGILDSIPYVKNQVGKFNDYVSSNLGNVKSNISAGISSNIKESLSGAKPVGNGGTVINAGMTVNYNGNLSRKQLKQLENDNYTAIKTRLKAEGAV